jgi:hypothetical protein
MIVKEMELSLLINRHHAEKPAIMAEIIHFK